MILFLALIHISSVSFLSCQPLRNVSHNVRDGPQRHRNLSRRQRDLPPLLPNLRLHIGGCLVAGASGQCLRLRVALPGPAGVPAHAARHLPPQAEEHHLFLFLGPRLQQRVRDLHQHGDLQYLVSEVHHLLAVHLRAAGKSTRTQRNPGALTDRHPMHVYYNPNGPVSLMQCSHRSFIVQCGSEVSRGEILNLSRRLIFQ